MRFFGSNIEQILDFFYSRLDQSSLPNYVIFLLFVLLAIAIGQIFPSILKLILYLFDREQKKNLYELFIQPIRGPIKFCSTLTLIYWANGLWPREYEIASEFLEPLIDLVFLLAIAWIISRILTQFIRAYGIKFFTAVRISRQ